MHEAALRSCVDRHLQDSAMRLRLDEELGNWHGLSWADFVLLALLEEGAATTPELAGRLATTPSRLVQQLLPLEKTGLLERAAAADGRRRIALRPNGRRLLREARETAATVCAELLRN